eukprot:719813-Pelagomonas_calceolata.AAC.1
MECALMFALIWFMTRGQKTYPRLEHGGMKTEEINNAQVRCLHACVKRGGRKGKVCTAVPAIGDSLEKERKGA